MTSWGEILDVRVRNDHILYLRPFLDAPGGSSPSFEILNISSPQDSACSLFSPMIKTQVLEVWQGEFAPFPTLPSPRYLLFLQENEKKKPQAIWFLEPSMCIDPITSKVRLSHYWPHSQHPWGSSPSLPHFNSLKGYFFTVISIEFIFNG